MKKLILLPVLLAAVLILVSCAAPAPSVDASKPTMTVSFVYADGLRYAPSYAIWVQDEAGNTATLYATGKAAKDSWGGQPRDNVLPVWKGVRAADVTSGATPAQKADLTVNIPDSFAGKTFTLFIEANASYDYNDYYAEGLKEGDEGYNNVNGQPSAVWTATIDASADGSAAPKLTGTGDVLGADHEVHDAQKLTTAAELLKGIKITWQLAK